MGVFLCRHVRSKLITCLRHKGFFCFPSWSWVAQKSFFAPWTAECIAKLTTAFWLAHEWHAGCARHLEEDRLQWSHHCCGRPASHGWAAPARRCWCFWCHPHWSAHASQGTSLSLPHHMPLTYPCSVLLCNCHITCLWLTPAAYFFATATSHAFDLPLQRTSSQLPPCVPLAYPCRHATVPACTFFSVVSMHT